MGAFGGRGRGACVGIVVVVEAGVCGKVGDRGVGADVGGVSGWLVAGTACVCASTRGDRKFGSEVSVRGWDDARSVVCLLFIVSNFSLNLIASASSCESSRENSNT